MGDSNTEQHKAGFPSYVRRAVCLATLTLMLDFLFLCKALCMSVTQQYGSGSDLSALNWWLLSVTAPYLPVLDWLLSFLGLAGVSVHQEFLISREKP